MRTISGGYTSDKYKPQQFKKLSLGVAFSRL